MEDQYFSQYMNKLPTDIQAEVMKSQSFYPRIAKSIYDPKLYYDKYCDKKISMTEFLTYIEEVKPDKFAVFSFEGPDISCLNFFKINNESYKNQAVYVRKTIHIIYFVLEEWFTTSISEIIQQLRKRSNKPYFFDLQTTYTILQRRKQCYDYNFDYGKEYVMNELALYTQPIVVHDKLSLFNYYKQLMYVDANNGHLRNASNVVVFNTDGLPYDRKMLDEFLQTYQPDIDTLFKNAKLMLS